MDDLISEDSKDFALKYSSLVTLNMEITSVSCVDDKLCDKDRVVNLNADFTLKICYLIIGSLGMVGNAFVILVILRFKQLRKTVTNQFLVNQSLVDFLAAFLIIATSFIRQIPASSSSLGKEIFCRAWLSNMLVWSAFTTSTYNFVLMTYERYFAIVYPMKPSRRITHRRAYALMVITWIFGLLFVGSYALTTSVVNEHDVCSAYTAWPNTIAQKATGTVTVMVEFIFPLILNSFANIHMSIVLKKHTFNNKDDSMSGRWTERMEKAQRNMVKTLILVFSSYVICWIWNQIYFTLYNFGYHRADLSSNFYHFTVIAVFCNCCMNPFLYMIKYHQFQKAVKQLFNCHRSRGTSNEGSISRYSECSTLSTGTTDKSMSEARGLSQDVGRQGTNEIHI